MANTNVQANLNDILGNIQRELKAPKNQRNSFGDYNYRSCEDILEAVKPLLGEAKLTISDEVVNIGERYYVKATARLFLVNNAEGIEVTAYAREEENKKKMDGSQITGAASSYARKYALNGLFLIDDTRDSDSTNTHENKNGSPKTSVPMQPNSTTPADVRMCSEHGEKMTRKRSKKTGKDFYSHIMPDGNHCFGGN
jgi:hypothetical protein